MHLRRHGAVAIFAPRTGDVNVLINESGCHGQSVAFNGFQACDATDLNGRITRQGKRRNSAIRHQNIAFP